MATLVLWLRVSKLTLTNPGFRTVGDDHVYAYMAAQRFGSVHVAPWCWRVLVPTLAHLSQLRAEVAFEWIAFLAIAATGPVIYLILRRWRFSESTALLSVILFYSMNYATKFNLGDFWLTDSAAIFFVALCILAAVSKKWLLFSVLMLVGVLAKESVIFVAPLAYTFAARKRWDSRALGIMAATALPAATALAALRFSIPAWNSNSAYIASLPRLVREDMANVASYNLMSVTYAAITARWHSWWQTLAYAVTSFGLLTMLLAGCGWRHAWAVLRYFWPFMLLVLSQLAFALNTQRLIVLAFVPVIIICAYGMDRLVAEKLLEPIWLFAAVAAAYGVELASSTASSQNPLLQAVGIGGLVVLGLGLTCRKKPQLRTVETGVAAERGRNASRPRMSS